MIATVRSLPFSIDWLPDGTLLITSGQRLLRMEADGSLVTHAELGHLSEHGGTRSSSTAAATPT